MVLANDLKAWGNGFPERIRFMEDGADLSLPLIKTALEATLDEYGVPFRIDKDQVQSGNLFKKQYEDCLSIINPLHESDYFKFCLRLQKVGRTATLYVHYYGTSVLTGKKNQEEDRKNSNSITRMALGAIFKTDQHAFEAEYDYYDIVLHSLRKLSGI